MTRALRYASLDELPPAMRASVELQQTRASPRKGSARPRKPRRDEEHEQQVVFFNRIRALGANEGRFRLAAARTYAIPNGGGRSKREAGRLKAEGVTKGVSDIFVSLPVHQNNRGLVFGLYIEMKSVIGRLSTEQDVWLDGSTRLGYAARVCRSADEACEVWKAYVDGRLDHDY